MTETATATNPNDASANPEASATVLAPASTETDTAQQTQPVQTQPTETAETAATDVQQTEPVKAPGAPEKYTFTAPEGTQYDAGILESFDGAAHEAGLTQEAAQKLIEKMAPAIAARQADQVQAIQHEWRSATTADKEFGGEKLPENLAVARRALDTFDPLPAGVRIVDGKPVGADGKPVTTPMRTLLETTGLGNHPEVIRFMFRAGKAISEDKFVGGSAGGTGKLNPTAVLYDKTTPK
jgi:hypothetical protein